MNLPNKITMLRIILIPIYMVVYLYAPPVLIFTVSDVVFTWKGIIAAAIFLIASLTDLLDGKIAREQNLVTNFGKLMDPLADKLLVTGALLCMLKLGTCNIWVAMIILTREFLVTGFRLVAASSGFVISAGMLGKIKTATQMITIIFATITGANMLVEVLFWISAVFTVISGYQYIHDNAGFIKDMK